MILVTRSKSVGTLGGDFSEIYPIYWIVLALIIGAGLLRPDLRGADSRGWPTLLSSTLLVAWEAHDFEMPQTILLVAWTLFHEIQFYAIFALLIFHLHVGLLIMGLWYLLSIVSLFLPVKSTLFSIYFAPIHLLFGMGIAAADAYRKFKGRYAGTCAVIGVGLFVMFARMELVAEHEMARQLASLPYGLASALMIYGFTGLERKYTLVMPALLILLGDASYVIYLTHQPLLIFAAKATAAAGAKSLLSPVVWYWVVAAAVVILATGVHILVERPILKASHRAASKPPREALATQLPP